MPQYMIAFGGNGPPWAATAILTSEGPKALEVKSGRDVLRLTRKMVEAGCADGDVLLRLSGRNVAWTSLHELAARELVMGPGGQSRLRWFQLTLADSSVLAEIVAMEQARVGMVH
jgi:hypothetical protein